MAIIYPHFKDEFSVFKWYAHVYLSNWYVLDICPAMSLY